MILISVDLSNLYYSVKSKFPNRKINYERYLECCKSLCISKDYRAIAYGAAIKNQAREFQDALIAKGFEIKYKEPKIFRTNRKADWDVGITIDIVKILPDVDEVVLGSADSDMVPVVRYIQEHGKRCCICACRISRDLVDVADRCYEITEDCLQ